MNETLGIFARHGASVLFAFVFIEQIGLPLPAAPILLAAGAMTVSGKVNWVTALAAAAAGSLLADMIWFFLGRRFGQRVLGLLCRVSLEPDSCVRRTQNVFTKYGMRGVVVAKFIPGVSTLVPPLAGNSGVGALRFLFFDGLSSALYAGSFLLVGMLFSNQLEQVLAALAGLGTGAVALVGGLVAGYVGYKYYQRRRLLGELRAARITVDELRQKQAAGESVLVLDVRAASELQQDPLVILGAFHVTMEEVERRHEEIPRDRDIILYCDCPNEVSSARVALLLHRKGFTRVRPLLGGIGA